MLVYRMAAPTVAIGMIFLLDPLVQIPAIIAPNDINNITSPQMPPKKSMMGLPVELICMDDIVVDAFFILAMLLEILGSIVIGFAYLPTFSGRAARSLKLA